MRLGSGLSVPRLPASPLGTWMVLWGLCFLGNSWGHPEGPTRWPHGTGQLGVLGPPTGKPDFSESVCVGSCWSLRWGLPGLPKEGEAARPGLSRRQPGRVGTGCVLGVERDTSWWGGIQRVSWGPGPGHLSRVPHLWQCPWTTSPANHCMTRL